MDPDLVQMRFSEAIELDPEEREVFLDSTCGSGTPLRAEIARLIAAYEEGRPLFSRMEEDLAGLRKVPILQDGELIAGRYQITRFLARGGVGEVYQAADREIEETIALKVLYAHAFSEAAVDRFRSEVRLSRKIQNPRVCRVHDVGRTRQHGREMLFLTMEFIPGQTLSSYLRSKGPLPWQDARLLVRDIAEALSAAHRLNILHCDLKPGNVMLKTCDGELRAILTDFGLAQTLQSAGGDGWFAGTPPYMAPEQLKGGACSVSTDIYAFGTMVFEILTGSVPQSRDDLFKGASEGPLQELHPRRIKTLRKCLETASADRYASVESAVADLDDPHGPTRRVLLSCAAVSAVAALPFLNQGVRIKLRLVGVPPNALTVIPFTASAPAMQFVADGLTHEIGNALARLPGLRLCASSPARGHTGDAKSFEAIVRDLSVRAVVSGSVEAAGEGYRISSRLVDIGDNRVIWSETYNLSAEQLPHVSASVTQAVVHQLPLRLAPQELVGLRSGGARNAEAYRCYLLGRFLAEKRDAASLAQSIEWYQKSAAADPSYASAFSGLAAAYNMIASKGVISRTEAFRLSDEHADHAVRIQSDLAEAHLVIASNQQHFHWNWKEAERHFQAACKAAPGLAMAHQWYAGLLSMLIRHDEALREIEVAHDGDPLSPAIQTAWAAFLHRAGRPAEAVDRLRWTLSRNPGFLNAQVVLASIYSTLGQFDEAVKTAGAAVAISGRASFAVSTLASALALRGARAEAASLLTELESSAAGGRAAATDVASVYRDLHDFDRVFEWIEAGFERRDAGLTTLKCDPANSILRSDPRYWKVLEKLSL